jgi:hypothetical protein
MPSWDSNPRTSSWRNPPKPNVHQPNPRTTGVGGRHRGCTFHSLRTAELGRGCPDCQKLRIRSARGPVSRNWAEPPHWRISSLPSSRQRTRFQGTLNFRNEYSTRSLRGDSPSLLTTVHRRASRATASPATTPPKGDMMMGRLPHPDGERDPPAQPTKLAQRTANAARAPRVIDITSTTVNHRARTKSPSTHSIGGEATLDDHPLRRIWSLSAVGARGTRSSPGRGVTLARPPGFAPRIHVVSAGGLGAGNPTTRLAG